jgi:hypothetical protein
MLVGVHPQVRGDEQRLAVGSVLREDRNAYAGADAHFVFTQSCGFIEQLHQRVSDMRSFRSAGRLFQNQTELVAPGSSDGI